MLASKLCYLSLIFFWFLATSVLADESLESQEKGTCMETRAVIGRVVSAHLKIWRETTIFYTLIEVSGRMAEYLACVQLTIWAERANPYKKLEFPPPVFNFF